MLTRSCRAVYEDRYKSTVHLRRTEDECVIIPGLLHTMKGNLLQSFSGFEELIECPAERLKPTRVERYYYMRYLICPLRFKNQNNLLYSLNLGVQLLRTSRWPKEESKTP